MVKKILFSILSVITTFFVSIKYVNNKYTFDGNDIRWLLLSIIIYVFLNYAFKKFQRRKFVFSISLGLILSIFYVLGYLGSIEFATTSEISLIIFFKFMVYLILLTSIIYLIYTKVDEFHSDEAKQDREYKLFTANKKSIFFVACVLFLLYLPYLLHYFPGNILIDSSIQILQGHGTLAYTNHHPILHTILIKMCMKTSLLLGGGYQTGAFIYTFLQTMCTAFIFSYSIYYMARKNVPKIVRVFVLIFYGICPTISFYTITMYKDIPFSLMILLTTIGTIEFVTNTKEFISSKLKITLLFLCVLFSLFFRNNGVYAFILMFPFIMIVMKKYWKYILIIYLVPIIIFEIASKPVYNSIGIIQGSPREALSIPIQQFARLMVYKESELTDDEKDKIREYLPIDDFSKYYMTGVSDPVKTFFSNEAFEKDKIGFFRLYFKLAKEFPDETFHSFILGNYGYYYPNTLGWGIWTGVDRTFFDKYGFYEIYHKPVVRINFLDDVNNFVNSRDVPIISTLINIGFLFWILLLSMFYTMYTKKYRELLIYLPVFFVWATVLASPIFAEPRYVYCLFTTLPLLVPISMFIKNKSIKKIGGLDEKKQKRK